MKKIKHIIIAIVIIFLLGTNFSYAHGGNITGWKDKNSSKITEFNEKYYGYHNQDGVRHYHEVEWNEEEQKWKIINSAIYYDENFNVIQNPNIKDEDIERVEVKYNASVDGDTAKFDLNGEIVTARFLGIDTPETVHPSKGEEPYGKEASNYTKERLESASKIELEYDTNSAKTDKYGRSLVWVFVDGELIQKELIDRGFAQTYMLQDNYRYAGMLQEAEQTAKSNKTGMWESEEITNDLTGSEGEIEENIVTYENNTNKVENTATNNKDNEKLNIPSAVGIIVVIVIALTGTGARKNKKRRKR